MSVACGAPIRAKRAPLIGFALALACSSKPAPLPPPDKKDGGVPDAPVAIELDAAPLGLAEVAAYSWRKRAGQPAFRLARKAEARDDWAAAVAACRQALAADPGHLDAAWLLAVGLAKLGKLDEILAPLQLATAGDFAKWGPASLEQPALQRFLATPVGEAWRRRVAVDRERYAAAIAHAVIVTADGDLYAFAPPGQAAESARWYRLSRTGGRVLGAIAVTGAQKIAYASRAVSTGKRELAVGVVDLVRGKALRPLAVGTAGPITVAYSATPPVGFWVGSGAAPAMTWRQLEDDVRIRALPAKTARPPGPWLEVTAKASARVHGLPANLTADWDDQALASAMRIASSNRVVSVASPGLIDGSTAVWSPDRVHVAFVAQLDDHCTAGAVNTAAFVADASTGGTRELERAAGGIALAWVAERTLVIAGDHGVAIHSLDESPAVPVPGATGLLVPRDRPRCAPSLLVDTPAEEPDPSESIAGDEPADAGVVDARSHR